MRPTILDLESVQGMSKAARNVLPPDLPRVRRTEPNTLHRLQYWNIRRPWHGSIDRSLMRSFAILLRLRSINAKDTSRLSDDRASAIVGAIFVDPLHFSTSRADMLWQHGPARRNEMTKV